MNEQNKFEDFTLPLFANNLHDENVDDDEEKKAS